MPHQQQFQQRFLASNGQLASGHLGDSSDDAANDGSPAKLGGVGYGSDCCVRFLHGFRLGAAVDDDCFLDDDDEEDDDFSLPLPLDDDEEWPFLDDDDDPLLPLLPEAAGGGDTAGASAQKTISVLTCSQGSV